MASSRIPNELLDLIFRDPHLQRRDVTRFARVSKGSLAVATPIIWESLTDILPLLALMSEDVWRWKQPGIRYGLCFTQKSLQRPLTEDDWNPVYARSCLVKTFTLRTDYSPGLPLLVVNALAACLPPSCLFPNLRQLHLGIYPRSLYNTANEVSGMLLSIALSPRSTPAPVKVVDISFGYDYHKNTNLHTSMFIDTLTTTWTSVGKVSIQLPVYPSHLLPSLTKLSSLESLDLELGEVLDYLAPPPSPILHFRSLLSLYISAITSKTFAALLHSFNFPSLEHLTVHRFHCDEADELTPVTQAIHDRISHDTLRHLSLQASEAQYSPLRFDHLQPLAAFQRLTHVHLLATHCVLLSDAEHAQVSSWWPALETIAFNTSSLRGMLLATMDTPATLDALWGYARNCPGLRNLRIPLTVLRRVSDVPPKPESGAHPLQTMCVGDSVLAEDVAEEAADIVDALFPLVELIYEKAKWSTAWDRVKGAVHHPD
ncbi:hypothetical protein EV121DRAFT_192072 [Schizophyllum commune]